MTDLPLSKIDAVVLAGGLGTRLRTAFGDTPKTLTQVGGNAMGCSRCKPRKRG